MIRGGKGGLGMTDDQINPDLKVQDPEVRAETKREMQKEWEYVPISETPGEFEARNI